jgi:hypothetical protein
MAERRLEGDGSLYGSLPRDGLAETRELPDGTPLVDPGSRPRKPHRADATRERPLFEREGLGRLAGHVAVTPVRRHDGRVYFEVVAEWGPDVDGRDVIGLAGLPSHHVVDTFATNSSEGALALGRMAADRLSAAAPVDPYALDRAGPPRPALDLPTVAKLLGVELYRAVEL